MTSLALKTHLNSPLAARLIPYLALFAGMVTLACGTSFAKTLFPVIGVMLLGLYVASVTSPAEIIAAAHAASGAAQTPPRASARTIS